MHKGKKCINAKPGTKSPVKSQSGTKKARKTKKSY